MSVNSIYLSYKKIFVFSISVEEVESNLGLRLNGVLFPSLEEKYKLIFSYIGIGLKICNLNVTFKTESDYRDFFKEEYELPILVSILLFFNLFSFNLDNYLCIGRVSENGDILSTKGTFASSMYVLNHGLCGIICPRDSCHEFMFFSNDIMVIACENILELINIFNHKSSVYLGNNRIKFFTPSKSEIILKDNCVLVGDTVMIKNLLQRLVVHLTKDQLFEMLSCISFNEELSKKYSVIRPVIDFQHCFSDFIYSLSSCKIVNFNKFSDELILNRSVFGNVGIDFSNAIFFNDFPIIYIHNFEFFSADEIDIIISFFTQKKFSNFKIILSAKKISERVKSLEEHCFKVKEISI